MSDYTNELNELELLLAEELNQQEQDLNPPDNEGWNGVHQSTISDIKRKEHWRD